MNPGCALRRLVYAGLWGTISSAKCIFSISGGRRGSQTPWKQARRFVGGLPVLADGPGARGQGAGWLAATQARATAVFPDY